MISTYDLDKLPDVNTYMSGLLAIRSKIKTKHYQILQAQYYAPGHIATASDLAKSVGISGGHRVVNRLYGGLGHMFCDATGFVPEIRPDDSARWWAVWSVGHSTKDRGFLWEMRTQLIEALQRLGWVASMPILEQAFLEEHVKLTDQSLHRSNKERLARLVSAPAYASEVHVLRTEFQRNTDVVATVLIAAKGYCDLCRAQAPFKRDSDGTPYLEVHHIVSLSKGGEDSLNNVVALCPNCHREMHHGQNQKTHYKHLKHIAESRADSLLSDN